MGRLASVVLLCAFALTFHLPSARADEPVDLLLVLASDVSRSVDEAKFRLQREGYANAITHPRVLRAITSGVHRRIAVCFVEWAGEGEQNVVIDWTAVGDAASAQRFAGQLIEQPRSFYGRTAIGAAIDFAMALFTRAPHVSERRTIDVSGDGTNIGGRHVTFARDEAVAKGVTINGLVILTDPAMSRLPSHTNPPGGLEQYYRENVIGGPGAQVFVANDFGAFGDAIVRKLVAEIAAVAP
jgi:hypothetical protein